MVRPGRDTDIKQTHVQRSWVWEKPSKFSSERAFLKLIWMGRGAFEVQVHWKTARSIYRRFYISLCIEKFPVFCIRRSSCWSQTPAGLSIISALLCDEAVGVQDGCPLTCREQKYHEISCICASQRQTSNLAEKLVFISRDADVGRCKAAIWTQRLYKLKALKWKRVCWRVAYSQQGLWKKK